MNTERPSTAKKVKPASGPKNGPAGKQPRTGRKPHARNSLYTLAAAFKRRHPLATAQGAWRHFAGLVGISTVLIAYDAAADVLTYAPDSERYGVRKIKRRSFEQAYCKLPG